MGYTHYWDIQVPFYIGEKQQTLIRNIIDLWNRECQPKSRVQFEEDDDDYPEVTDTMIRFNGTGVEAHETFYFQTNRQGFAFCKTARKPYDTVVCAVLAVLYHYYRDAISVSSDGINYEDKTWDEEWDDGVSLASRVMKENLDVPMCRD